VALFLVMARVLAFVRYYTAIVTVASTFLSVMSNRTLAIYHHGWLGVEFPCLDDGLFQDDF
jgi:hypothetical protein